MALRIKHLILTALLLASAALTAQDNSVRLQVEIVHPTKTENGTVTLEVKGGDTPYTFLIATKLPSQGGEIIQEVTTSDRTVTFTDLPKGEYHISVTDSEHYSAFQRVKLKRTGQNN